LQKRNPALKLSPREYGWQNVPEFKSLAQKKRRPMERVWFFAKREASTRRIEDLAAGSTLGESGFYKLRIIPNLKQGKRICDHFIFGANF
jgi:hypothetical protein